jgi:peptidoglycan hydrolase-like protein with peptidoglycan-binding domain
VLAADARKDQARKKTASLAVTAAVAAAPTWPSITSASDLSKNDVGNLARELKHQHHAERVLLAYGDTSSAVAELQRALKIADDGIFGPQTRWAVREFQKQHSLRPTGKVDVKTWLKLFPTDLIVYAPPGSTSALGVNDTDEPEWAAVSADGAGAPAAGAAVVKAAAHGKKHDAHVQQATMHAASATIGSNGPPVTIAPNAGGPAGGADTVPGVLGGPVAPTSGGGGGGSFKFPPLDSFGSAKEMISAMIGMANRIDSRHYAYRWGGGHNAAFSGPYDCSGAVSAVLHAAGLVGSPKVSGDYMHWGAPGRGAVTIYANAGHVYMSILGRFFGTTRANPGGGAGWFHGAPRAGFAVVHVPFSSLHLKGHHKKHKRHKKRSRRHVKQRRGPLNKPSTTQPPSSTGGSQSPPPSSSPPPAARPASSQPAGQPAASQQQAPPPSQQAPATQQQSAPAAQQQPTPAAQQPAPAAQQPAPAGAPAPLAPTAPPAAAPGPADGTGPASSPAQPGSPATPAPPVSAPGDGSGPGTGTPPAPAAGTNGQQQGSQPTPTPVATAQEPVTQAAQQAADPATAAAPPEPAPDAQTGSPAGQAP